MKRLLHRLPIIRFMIVMFAILPLTFQNFAIGSCESIEEQTSIEASEKITMNGLVVSVNVGQQEIIRLGRETAFNITIEGQRKGFEGNVLIHLPDAEGDSIIYKKYVSVKAGETKNCRIEAPVMNLWAYYAVELINIHDERVLYKELPISIQNDMMVPYMGVITSQASKLFFLKSDMMKVHYIEANQIPERTVDWDSFDYVVVDDFDLFQCSNTQINSLKQWVEQGGTLVLGTGAAYEKTIVPLEKAGIVETKQVEEELEATTYYGYDKSDLHEMISQYSEEQAYPYRMGDLKLEMKNFRIEGSSILCKDEKPVVERCDLGSGRILVFHFQLSSNAFGRQLFESDIIETIRKNLSNQRKEQLSYQYLDTNVNCNRIAVIDELGNARVPSILLYVIMILIYIIVVIPLIFIFLAKLKKQKKIWISLLGITFIFTLLMIGISYGSRDTDLKSNSFNLLYYKDHVIREKSIFNITVPFDDKYEVDFDGAIKIAAFNAPKYLYYSDAIEGKEEDYTLGDNVVYITQEDMFCRLRLENMTAFQKKYFMAEKEYEVEGDYSADFVCDAKEVSGSFHNNMGYQLRDAFYIGNGVIAYLGDVENGKNSDSIQEIRPLLNINNTEVAKFIGQCLPQGSTNTAEVDAVYSMITSYFETEIDREVIVGFVGNGYKDGIGTQLGEQTKTKDVNLLVLPVKSKSRDESEEYVYTLGSDYDVVAGDYSYGNAYRYMSGSVTLRYHLPIEDKVKSLDYSTYSNQEYHSDYYAGFDGTIYFYNHVTGHFDEVFLNGERSVLDVKNYIDANHCITVKYQASSEVAGVYVSLPYISYSKEAR